MSLRCPLVCFQMFAHRIEVFLFPPKVRSEKAMKSPQESHCHLNNHNQTTHPQSFTLSLHPLSRWDVTKSQRANWQSTLKSGRGNWAINHSARVRHTGPCTVRTRTHKPRPTRHSGVSVSYCREKINASFNCHLPMSLLHFVEMPLQSPVWLVDVCGWAVQMMAQGERLRRRCRGHHSGLRLMFAQFGRGLEKCTVAYFKRSLTGNAAREGQRRWEDH